MMKDYKIGKAYEYFVSGWLQEIYFHSIKKTSKVCLLRAKCCPSQRLRDDHHDVWVCLEKTSGAIHAAYCTCIAGLGQTCNHVAALLFRIEAANRYGLSSCTSITCNWKTPNVKKLEPSKLVDLQMKKSNRAKKVKSRPLVEEHKKKYQPLQGLESVDPKDTLDSISIALRGLLPNACLFTALPKESNETTTCSSTDPGRSEISASAIGTPVTHQSTLDSFTLEYWVKQFKSQTTCHDFLTFLPILKFEDINLIENSTIGQSENNYWFLLRKDRITASKFHSVFTKVATVLKSVSTSIDCSSLLKIIMGYTKVNPNVKSLKYGRETEPIAIEAYLKSFRKTHNNISYRKCGMFVDNKFVYLSATPDLLVSCSCCGEGLLEVKCPMVKECLNCSGFCCCVTNLPECLIFQNNELLLKTNHSYYTQVQGQLFITGRKWCDLFLYTVNGNLEQRIVLDPKFYDTVLPNLKYFYVNYVVPELLSPKLISNIILPEPMEIDTDVLQTYFCPICKNVIKESENISSYNQRSVECDQCQLWYHFKCVNFKQSPAKKSWICPKCIN